MCLSVNKTTSSHDIVNEFLEARLEQKASPLKSEKVVVPDRLAQSVQYTRILIQLITARTKNTKKSILLVLTRTTQPAHVASILLVLTICYCVWPELHGRAERPSNNLTSLLYLGSFAAHFGAQIWMTFVSGLALYFALPRHTFGRCQEILFPKYFLLNTLLSSVTMITFAKLGRNDTQRIVQLTSLATCVTIEMTIYFYLTPSLLKCMHEKYQFEKSLGNGQEIGHQETFIGLKCRRYQEINSAFRKIHMTCAIGNVIAICCSFIHLYYLASSISAL